MNASRGSILLIEDNRNLALGVRVNLEDVGYQVTVAHTIADGLTKLRRGAPSLLILDLSLPDGDGLEFLARLRAAGDQTLVMVLTAKTQQDIKLSGLRCGADDYVTKPFDLEELLVRVEVLLRRKRVDEPAPSLTGVVSLGDVDVDMNARQLRRRGETLPISRIGFDLLVTLLARRGTVVSRAELMREVWGYGEDVVSRTLDTHIFELRKLVEPDPAAPTHIKTVWRIGYRMD